MRIEIKSRLDAIVLFSIEADSWRLAVEAAVKSRANLSRADLPWADLSGADLSGADLSWANLSGANLFGANLSWANLFGFFSFGPGGSRNAYTWARWEDSGYMVHCGYQTLSLEDFEAAVKKKHGKTFYAKWYLANIATMKLIAKESKPAWEKYLAEKKKEAVAA